ncbi:hypothetical protein BHM03_00037435 [Ensete ventricosum]|nr:hypothetical protein BHM03_00037435 [Ensete ventricosum]
METPSTDHNEKKKKGISCGGEEGRATNRFKSRGLLEICIHRGSDSGEAGDVLRLLSLGCCTAVTRRETVALHDSDNNPALTPSHYRSNRLPNQKNHSILCGLYSSNTLLDYFLRGSDRDTCTGYVGSDTTALSSPWD